MILRTGNYTKEELEVLIKRMQRDILEELLSSCPRVLYGVDLSFKKLDAIYPALTIEAINKWREDRL